MKRSNVAMILILLILCVAVSVSQAQEYRPVVIEFPADQAETLRATFNNGYSEYFGRGLEADMARASRDVVLMPYDRGNQKDIGAYRAMDTEGVVERALWVRPGHSHRYDAAGNVNLRRGTVAFWVRFVHPVGQVHHSLFSINHVDRSSTMLGVRGRYGRILVHGPWGGSYDFESDPWEAEKWYHLAIAWDELEGIRLYVDGALKRNQQLTWQTEDLEPDKILAGSWSYWNGTEKEFALDELRIFSRPLSDEEVAAVHGGAATVPDVRVEDSEAVTTHRSEYLGWDSADLLGIEAADDDETLLVRQAGIDDARAIYSQAWKVCDGDRLTRWPLTYHGYSFQDEGGLILRLEDGERWDYLRVRGPVHGDLYQGEQVLEPEAEPWMPMKGDGPLFTRQFDGAMTQTAMTFFADTKPQETTEDGAAEDPTQSIINEIGFYETSTQDVDDLSGSAVPCYISADQWSDWSSEIGRIMLSKYETYDRTALRCSTDAPTEARALPMKGMRYYHFMIPSASTDRALGAIRLRLHFRDLEPGTEVWALVADPIIPTRQIADFEVRAEGDWSGIKPLDLTLDMRDYVIPAGQPLWVRLMTGSDAQLVWDADNASRFELMIEPPSVLTDQYRKDQLALVKDRFIDVSEPRPWGRVSMDQLAERVGVFMELHRALNELHTRFPDDNYARAVHIWTHPSEPVDRTQLQPPTVPGAPEWAVYQRAALGKYLDFVNWWIDHRQAPNGEFGHGYGDDTDLVNDWVSLSMIADRDGKIADSLRRIADFCWETSIENGINRRATDPLHAYEEGVNAVARTAEVYPGNPVYLSRLMDATVTVDEYLTGMTHGFRHFRSKNYGASRIITEFPYGHDALSSALMLHPSLYLGWYSRNERATRLVQEYGDAWLDLLESELEGIELSSSTASVLPVEIDFETREVVRRSNVFSAYGSDNMYTALAEWTGDDRYWLPARTWLMRKMTPGSTLPDMAERADLTADRDWIIESAAAISFADLNPSMGNDSRTQTRYSAWKLGADRELLVEALRDSWERIELVFPMHTWVEQSADRVWISKDLVDRMYLGGQPGYRNYIYPTHAISWQGLSRDFAAWVLEDNAQGLKLMAYNFEEAPQQGRIFVWGVEPGTYRVTLGPDANEEGVPDSATSSSEMALAKGSAVEIELPSRQTVALQIEQIAASGEDYYARPDLAICPQDTVIAEDATSITVRVHNIGGGTAPEATVLVRGDDGKPDIVTTAGPLEAPHECVPSIVELMIEVPEDRRGRQFNVIVDPENEIAELFEENNVVELPAG